MSVYDDIAPRAEPARDRYGRYLIAPADGSKPVAHTRATTIAETLDDRYNLEQWKMRQVAVGLAARPDLLAQAAAHTADDKTVLNDVCKQAMDAAASKSGANLGTALHRVIERLNRGERFDVPDMFTERVAAYRRVTAPLTIRRDLVECIAVIAADRVAGTFDMAVELDGRLYVADLKTGGGIEWGAGGFAVQLAIYAHADTLYDPASGTHRAAPDFDRQRALVVHVPAAGGEPGLHWLDIAAGWEAYGHAMWARRWRKRRDLLTPYDDDTPTSTHRIPSTIGRGESPPDEGRIDSRYLEKARAGVAAAALTAAEKRRLVGWLNEATGSRQWRITADTSTQRRFELYRAAVRLARWAGDDDDARVILGVALGVEVQPAMLVGTAIGALTIDEARTLAAALDALLAGKQTLRFASDGTPKLVGVA